MFLGVIMNDDDETASHVVQRAAGELASILDTQGLVALLAHMLFREQELWQERCGSEGLFTEDQIYCIILQGHSHVEHVALGSSLESTSCDAANPSHVPASEPLLTDDNVSKLPRRWVLAHLRDRVRKELKEASGFKPGCV
jgi:hypothetical protein